MEYCSKIEGSGRVVAFLHCFVKYGRVEDKVIKYRFEFYVKSPLSLLPKSPSFRKWNVVDSS